jgi:hypothetical protein
MAETVDHIYTCSDTEACNERTIMLYQTLHDMEQAAMPQILLNVMENKLTRVLNIESCNHYKITTDPTPTEKTPCKTQSIIRIYLDGIHSYVATYLNDGANKPPQPKQTRNHAGQPN